MHLTLSRTLLVALVCGCTTPQQPEHPPLAVPGKSAPRSAAEPTAPEKVLDGAVEFETYIEAVDLGKAASKSMHAKPFVDGYVLLQKDLVSGPRYLLDATTLALKELPPFDGNVQGSVEIHVDGDSAYAEIRDKTQTHRFQVLRRNPMRWEQAGEFATPDVPAGSKSEAHRPAVRTQTWRGLVVTVSDGRDADKWYRLDEESLIWTEFDPNAGGPACKLPCLGLKEDLIRWGIEANSKNQACVAVRPNAEEEWTRMDDIVGVMRSCRRIGANEVLVVGGVEAFKIFPRILSDAHLVTLDPPKVEPLGFHPQLGRQLELPGDDLVWLDAGSLVRFDPETRKFAREDAPAPEWEVRWRVKLDDRTLLIGGVDDDLPVSAKLGFREKR